ncbi:hypothetical protein MASR2M79_12500 [Aminivibrio sp.]
MMQIGFVVSLNSPATGILQRFSGRLADRFPKRKLILAGGSSSVTLLGLPNLTSPVSLGLASIAFGVGHAFASLWPLSRPPGVSLRIRENHGAFQHRFSMGMTTGPVITGCFLT